MESNKNISPEQHKSTGQTGSSQTTQTGSSQTHTGTTQGSIGSQTGTVAQRAREREQQSREGGYEQAKQAVSSAYEKTAETLSNTYDQALEYGRANPGKLTLIAFGAGIGVGILLASGMTARSSRTSRIIQPVVGALSEIAYEVFR